MPEPAAHGRLRVATLGTGYFSRFQYRAWKRIEAVDLVAVCNRTRQTAEDFAREFGIPHVFDALEPMLDAVRPDLLDIITPPPTHAAAIAAAAARGIDVICQKPFCTTLAEAEAAVTLAENAGISLLVHENFRFQPWHRQAKRILDSGRLGTVYQATFRLRPGDGQGARAYLDRQPYFQTMPRFLVHETAIHLIDVFRFFFGEVKSVYADLRRLNPAIMGEDAGLIILDMANGPRAVFDGNRLVDHVAHNRRLTMGEMLIEAEAGVLRLDGDGRLFLRAQGEVTEAPVDYTWRDNDFGGDCVFALQSAAIAAREGLRAFENTGRGYLANLKVEEAVYASSAAGRRIVLG